MDLILSLIGGGNGFIVALGGIAAAVAWAFFKGRKSERNANRAKEADAYEQHLEDIERAAHARNSVSPDSVVPDDRYRRD